MDTDARFWAKVDRRSDNECWPWLAYVDPKGYGRFHTTTEQRAYRWSYRRFIGPIEPGKVVDHVCRNRGCVNPQHLRLLTPLQNTFAPGSQAPAKLGRDTTHCPKGHEWTPENTVARKGGRYCRACRNARGRRLRVERRRPVCPLGHVKTIGISGRWMCQICRKATYRSRHPVRVTTTFGCGHLRAETGQLNRRGQLYCSVCRSEKRKRPDSIRAKRGWRY